LQCTIIINNIKLKKKSRDRFMWFGNMSMYTRVDIDLHSSTIYVRVQEYGYILVYNLELQHNIFI
jgi:hypothetical protein